MNIPQCVLEEWAKDCRDGCGLCGDRPCGACMAGGICHQSRCTCDDEPEPYDDDDETGGER